jgi:hypothetical protein
MNMSLNKRIRRIAIIGTGVIGARWGLATSPKKLTSIAIKRLLFRALIEQGIREQLPKGVKRYEWKGPQSVVK